MPPVGLVRVRDETWQAALDAGWTEAELGEAHVHVVANVFTNYFNQFVLPNSPARRSSAGVGPDCRTVPSPLSMMPRMNTVMPPMSSWEYASGSAGLPARVST